MKKQLFVLLILFFVTLNLFCQNEKQFFVGINPSVTIEPSYPKGAFDINIFPLVIEYPLVNNFNIRGITVLNYGFRNLSSALINIGAEVSVPYYFMFGKNKPAVSSGFFIAAGAAYTRNIYYSHNNVSVFLEPGYNFSFDNKFSLIIDLQYGRTFFIYDDGSRITGNHFGVKVILGWWLK